ncbi:UDP-N-acetylglucosamine 2-epimerase [bacterium]|nr:UDP-N-acetylglucosamine 2-epimerase [bacterium]
MADRESAMKITVVTGSRADYGMLEWPIKLLEADPFFEGQVLKLWNMTSSNVHYTVENMERPDVMLLLGDRFEIMAAATAAHLRRIPIAHIAGGDVTEGSYDDAMRDAISRMASIHFVTSTSAMSRLTHMGYRNVHLVGSTGIDYIKHADWKRERPYSEPYVVVSYQAETIDGTNDIERVIDELPKEKAHIFILPNPDAGNNEIISSIFSRSSAWNRFEFLPHDHFLNLIYHCDEFIGNSSAMLYEAPELGIKTRMIGKRQRGRVIPWGDGHASERIVKSLKYGTL